MVKQTVVVIGAGPAGMMAAAAASSRGKRTILIEQNQIGDQVLVGKKLLITGNGRCNITNDTDCKGLIANVPQNGRFLYSAFHAFAPSHTISLLERYGVKTKVEDRGRVLPQSDRSKDVVAALRSYVEDQGVQIKLGQVNGVSKLQSGTFAINMIADHKNESIKADIVIIATGGKSYPQTGSTGDGYRFASELGHHITQLNASLVPIETKEKWVKDVQGISLRNVAISVVEMDHSQQQEGNANIGKLVFTEQGDLLFTHYGLTGPVIYSASAHVVSLPVKKYSITIDTLPEVTHKQLEQMLLLAFESNGKKQVGNLLQELLLQKHMPKKLVPIILTLADVANDKLANQISQVDRKKVVALIKQLPLSVKRLRPLEDATVTAGGVDVNEINPKTMESKLVKGLFFAGEVLDVNGYTGGFNIQIALSTGHIAGISC